ncbi:MAG: hypothetical protein OXH11_18240, partial [Candidatus Aminicenantes bacterium]|nr:hypothetical protein [Candidatus Aminicenantes bacterium]
CSPTPGCLAPRCRRRSCGGVKAEITKASNVGTVFMTFHYPETRTNILVGDAKDEFTGCPEYKVSAVRLEKVATGIEESFALPGVTIEGEPVPVDHREPALAKA